jgi:hypothetical protein
VNLDSFATITEFGVALAGFSALAAALTQRPGELPRVEQFRTINLLFASLTPAFVSTFPMIGEAFGAHDESLWRGTSIGFAVVLTATVIFTLHSARSLSAADHAFLSKAMWALFLGGHTAVSIILLLNALGSLAPPGPGPILACLVWLLFIGAMQLIRIVVARPAA